MSTNQMDAPKDHQNGVDGVCKTGDPSESDPCIEEHKGHKMWDDMERKLCDKSGLSRRGLYYVCALALSAFVLFLVVVVLASLWPVTPHSQQFPVCRNAACLRASAQIQQFMNQSVSKCENFLNWACGSWFSVNQIPADRSKWNQEEELTRQEASRIRELITTLPLPLYTGTVKWKLKHLYEACLDVDNVNVDEARPLTSIITSLGGWYVLRDWSMESFDYKQTMRFLHVKFGVTPYFRIDVVPNPMSPGNSSISISPSGLGLPDRSYYYLPSNHSIITAYKQLIRDVVINLGSPTSRAEKFGNDVFFYEQRIAEITPDSIDLLNPVTTYNPIKMSELKFTTPTLPLQDILSEMFPSATIEPDTEVIVTHLDYLYKISQIMSTTDRITMNSYMIWTLVRNYLPYLSSSMTSSVNAFKTQLFGMKQPLQRWEFCSNLVQKFMPEAIDFMLEQNNPVNNRTVEIVEKMFDNLREVAKLHLMRYKNMPDLHSLLTKKLSTLKLQIGLRNLNKSEESLRNSYSGLSILKTNLFESYKNGIYFLKKNKERRLIENRKEDFITNLAVNYPYKVKYLPSSNMLIIPRVLLNPPIFENDFPIAVLYGRLGVEMALGIANSILPYESLWTSSLKLLTTFHSTVNESLRLVRYQTHCLTNYIKLNGLTATEHTNMTALSTFKYLSALKLAYEGLHLHLDKYPHTHQPSLETFEDPTLFYLTHIQNLCSRTTKQQELHDNLVNFKLSENALLKTAWMQESTVSESFECNFNTDNQCSDIF